MREFAVIADEGVAGFLDIDALARDCRYADCSHATEPGCALRAAVDRGELPLDRLESYLSIERDAERARAKNDPYSRHLEKREGRRFGKLVRAAVEHKNKR